MESNHNKQNQRFKKLRFWERFKILKSIEENWERFKYVTIAIIGIVILFLCVNLLNGINELLEGKPLAVQYVVWTILGLGFIAVIGLAIYHKGKIDGTRDARVMNKGLEIQISKLQNLNRKIHQESDKNTREVDERNDRITLLEQKILKKDNAFHKLRDDINKIKVIEVKDELLKRWEEVCELAEVAKERVQETPGQIVRLNEQSKLVAEKAKQSSADWTRKNLPKVQEAAGTVVKRSKDFVNNLTSKKRNDGRSK